MTTIDLDRAPSDDELDDWIAREGETMPAFVAACEQRFVALIEDGEMRAPEVTMVPYGSTSVALPDSCEMPEKVLRSVAFEWWEQEHVLFVLGPDDPYSCVAPYRYLVNVEPRGEAS